MVNRYGKIFPNIGYFLSNIVHDLSLFTKRIEQVPGKYSLVIYIMVILCLKLTILYQNDINIRFCNRKGRWPLPVTRGQIQMPPYLNFIGDWSQVEMQLYLHIKFNFGSCTKHVETFMHNSFPIGVLVFRKFDEVLHYGFKVFMINLFLSTF
jgi:hypothetical protein